MIIKRISAGLALMAMAACQSLPPVGGIPAAPAAGADTIKLDERIALGGEALYQGAVLIARTRLTFGGVSAAEAGRWKRADETAHDAVKALRSAYAASNAASYTAAWRQAQLAIRAFVSLVTGDGS